MAQQGSYFREGPSVQWAFRQWEKHSMGSYRILDRATHSKIIWGRNVDKNVHPSPLHNGRRKENCWFIQICVYCLIWKRPTLAATEAYLMNDAVESGGTLGLLVLFWKGGNFQSCLQNPSRRSNSRFSVMYFIFIVCNWDSRWQEKIKQLCVLDTHCWASIVVIKVIVFSSTSSVAYLHSLTNVSLK